jgi:N-acetyl-D-muramate 6-phosphate phosphatase
MPLDIQRIHAICFDIDGTLSDTDDKMVRQFSELFKPLSWINRKMDRERIARRLVMGIETPGNWILSIPDRLGLDDELAWLGEKLVRRDYKPPSFLLIPGVIDMLEQIRIHFPLAVVSARNESAATSFLDQFGLRGYFHHIITAQTCEHTKPFPDPILHAAKLFNLQPSEVLMVGDTTVDILSARKAGAQSAGVLCGFGEEKELRRAGADLILQTTSDLLNVLNGITPVQPSPE